MNEGPEGPSVNVEALAGLDLGELQQRSDTMSRGEIVALQNYLQAEINKLDRQDPANKEKLSDLAQKMIFTARRINP